MSLVLATGLACSEDADTWNGIVNPVHGLADEAIKDAFAARADGHWHLGYSQIREAPFRFRLGFARSEDWRDFDAGATLDDEALGGLASPDVVARPGGGFVMTYNSHTLDLGEALPKLYMRTSDDLRTWSEATRIRIEGLDEAEDRLIDAALAFTADAGVFLMFKREQSSHLAHAPNLEGPWTEVGPVSPLRLENFQLIQLDGVWHMLATSQPVLHRPLLYRIGGDPSQPASWQSWELVRELEIPEQSWNTGNLDYERANAAYLIDSRADDGYYYLLYAGSTEITSFEGRGKSSLGLARSLDLATWEPAPER